MDKQEFDNIYNLIMDTVISHRNRTVNYNDKDHEKYDLIDAIRQDLHQKLLEFAKRET